MDFWEAATADRVSKSMKGVREVCHFFTFFAYTSIASWHFRCHTIWTHILTELAFHFLFEKYIYDHTSIHPPLHSIFHNLHADSGQLICRQRRAAFRQRAGSN